MTDEFDPEQAASMLVQQHGEDAARYAAQWATALLEAGNRREARRFVRIIRAIRHLTRSRDGTRLAPARRGRSGPQRGT